MKKTATLKRFNNGKNTLGDFTCETLAIKILELPWLGNKPQVSCIPTGTYDVKWTYSPLFKKYTYEIMNVPKRSGIRIHAGNFASLEKSDSKGCPLTGLSFKDINKDGIVDIASSTIALRRLEEFFGKESFKLIIK